MLKKIIGLLLVCTFFINANIYAGTESTTTETIYYPDGDWMYNAVSVSVLERDSFLNALNMLVSGESMPANCYNEFPAGTKVKSFEQVDPSVFYVVLGNNISKTMDDLDHSYLVMNLILSQNIIAKYPDATEIHLFVGKEEVDVYTEEPIPESGENVLQVESFSQTIESILLDPENLNLSEDEIKGLVRENLDQQSLTSSTYAIMSSSLSGYKICIDPGHGSYDYGATATYNGVTYYEKDLNLSIATYLKSYLQGKGATIYMTRDYDVTTTLSRRVNIANSNNVDLFVSVHCNSSTWTFKSGTTCIWPSNHDVSDSCDLAFSVNDQVYADTPFSYYQPYQDTRGLAVLNGTTMPAIITETGYMSYGADLIYLINASNRQTIANAIANGIDFYVN